MANYKETIAKITNTQLKSASKNKTRITLRITKTKN